MRRADRERAGTAPPVLGGVLRKRAAPQPRGPGVGPHIYKGRRDAPGLISGARRTRILTYHHGTFLKTDHTPGRNARAQQTSKEELPSLSDHPRRTRRQAGGEKGRNTAQSGLAGSQRPGP